MCIKVEWKIFKNIGFLTIKKATVKLKNRFYSCFFAIKLASGEWQVASELVVKGENSALAQFVL